VRTREEKKFEIMTLNFFLTVHFHVFFSQDSLHPFFNISVKIRHILSI
jgi:hypothetical protein